MPHPVVLFKFLHVLSISYSASRTSVGILQLLLLLLFCYIFSWALEDQSSSHHSTILMILPEVNPCTLLLVLLDAIFFIACYFHTQEQLQISLLVNSPEVNFISFFLSWAENSKDFYFSKISSHRGISQIFKWALLTWMPQSLLLAKDSSEEIKLYLSIEHLHFLPNGRRELSPYS